MTNFESPIRHIAYPQEKVYAKLSDLNNLEAMKDKLPADKIQNFNFDNDHVSFSAPGMGGNTMMDKMNFFFVGYFKGGRLWGDSHIFLTNP